MKAKEIKQTVRQETRKSINGKVNANSEQVTTSAQDANVTATSLAKSLLLAKSFEMAKAVCNMMASKDETKKESEYFKSILDSVSAENWQDCEKLVTRWTESTNESDTFISRIVRTDETDKEHKKQLVQNVPENVVQIVSNLHSWYSYTEWKKTAKRNALLRKLKNMSLEELAELVGED